MDMKASDLSKKQIAAIQEWADAGTELGLIQAKLESEHDIKLTFLDTRFLLADLEIEIAEPEAPAKKVEENEEAENPTSDSESSAESSSSSQQEEVVEVESEVLDTPSEPSPESMTPSNVSVSVDSAALPGALASGKVTFSDGKSASWVLDQTGQLGLDGVEKGYRPSEADSLAFQTQLQSALEKSGF